MLKVYGERFRVDGDSDHVMVESMVRDSESRKTQSIDMFRVDGAIFKVVEKPEHCDNVGPMAKSSESPKTQA